MEAFMLISLLCIAACRGLTALFDWCDSAPPPPADSAPPGERVAPSMGHRGVPFAATEPSAAALSIPQH